jgi:Leucine-rich repeat (LRR) protein
MKKCLISILTLVIAILVVIPVVFATPVTINYNEDVRLNLSRRNITNERLAEMVASGRIPPNVTTLILVTNQISDISPLSGLTNLVHLELGINQITVVSLQDLFDSARAQNDLTVFGTEAFAF